MAQKPVFCMTHPRACSTAFERVSPFHCAAILEHEEDTPQWEKEKQKDERKKETNATELLASLPRRRSQCCGILVDKGASLRAAFAQTIELEETSRD